MDNKTIPLQQITYGAPGTGKSYETDNLTKSYDCERTTFHPDSDYSTFVGSYKPMMKEREVTTLVGTQQLVVRDSKGDPVIQKVIEYDFCMQAFLKAYVGAWKNHKSDKRQFLVIEEINRGNCAQIFGDLFQLLDRNGYGYSSYPITSDSDLQKKLSEELADVEIDDLNSMYENISYDLASCVKNGEKLLLPNNLYIWATMNTSDQSLFPIDSAFKRRWDWKYVPISDAKKDFKIEVTGSDIKTMHYDWWEFLDKVNTAIGGATSSEDKKLGYFFCKANKTVNGEQDPRIITADRFVSKVVFYIWNDVFKDYSIEDGKFTFTTMDAEGKEIKEELSLLSYTVDKEEKELKFADFFNPDGSVKIATVEQLMQNLKIKGKEVEIVAGGNPSDEV